MLAVRHRVGEAALLQHVVVLHAAPTKLVALLECPGSRRPPGACVLLCPPSGISQGGRGLARPGRRKGSCDLRSCRDLHLRDAAQGGVGLGAWRHGLGLWAGGVARVSLLQVEPDALGSAPLPERPGSLIGGLPQLGTPSRVSPGQRLVAPQGRVQPGVDAQGVARRPVPIAIARPSSGGAPSAGLVVSLGDGPERRPRAWRGRRDRHAASVDAPAAAAAWRALRALPWIDAASWLLGFPPAASLETACGAETGGPGAGPVTSPFPLEVLESGAAVAPFSREGTHPSPSSVPLGRPAGDVSAERGTAPARPAPGPRGGLCEACRVRARRVAVGGTGPVSIGEQTLNSCSTTSATSQL